MPPINRLEAALTSSKARLTLCAGVTAVLCWLLFPSTPEPQFEGRPLSAWLQQTFHYQFENRMIAGFPFARFNEAMQTMGTNTIPYLVKMLSAKDYPGCAFALRKLGGADKPFVNRIGLNTPWFRRVRAAAGFRALGPRATNAIPAIVRMGAFDEMVQALDGIGPNGLPLVLDEIEKGPESVRFNGLFGLQAKAYARRTVVDTWIRYTNDPSPRVHWAATLLLWSAPAQHRILFIPALNRLQEDKDSKVAALAKSISQRIASSTAEFQGMPLLPSNPDGLAKPE